jgi:Na+-translocating ferredoxin:NAD+ oxidoreductase RnfD subunit
MSEIAAMPSRPAVARFFRKPKGMLLLIFALLVLLAALGMGPRLVARGLAAAMIAAAVVDALLMRYMDGGWRFPDGGLLTGMIVGMILSPLEPWHVAAVTSVVGVASKHIFRTRTANIFNPAALALVATFPVFGPAQDWWGALPEITPYALVALVASGVFITDRVNKLPVLLSFLGGYFLLFTVTAFLGNPARVAEIYRTPDLQAVLFFGFFMVTDPPTSPPRQRDQIVFGVITAVASYAAFELIGAAYYLLAGLLVANAWEARRRTRSRPGRRRKQPEVLSRDKPHLSGAV